jgi:hypothetical protein
MTLSETVGDEPAVLPQIKWTADRRVACPRRDQRVDHLGHEPRLACAGKPADAEVRPVRHHSPGTQRRAPARRAGARSPRAGFSAKTPRSTRAMSAIRRSARARVESPASGQDQRAPARVVKPRRPHRSSPPATTEDRAQPRPASAMASADPDERKPRPRQRGEREPQPRAAGPEREADVLHAAA